MTADIATLGLEAIAHRLAEGSLGAVELCETSSTSCAISASIRW